MKHFRASDTEWEQGQGYRKRKVFLEGVLPRPVDFLQEVRFRKGATVPMHYHRVQTEIFFVLAPGSITIDGVAVDAEAGDVIVCEPGEVHGMPLVEEDFGFLVMKIDHREDDTVWL
ncbi:MAG: cupin domain-containing protein [Methanomassiliicoccus sp.]|nr:cupin domain-containing protein [Methanomassiliicoccus sp.]